MERLLRVTAARIRSERNLRVSRSRRDVCTPLEYSILASRNHSRLARGARISTVSPYLDACFRTNTKSIMRAMRENRALFPLTLLSRTRACARGKGGSGSTLVFTPSTPVATPPWWSTGAQRSMPPSGPSMLRPHCIRHSVVMTTTSPPTPPGPERYLWWGTWVAAKGVRSPSPFVPSLYHRRREEFLGRRPGDFDPPPRARLPISLSLSLSFSFSLRFSVGVSLCSATRTHYTYATEVR